MAMIATAMGLSCQSGPPTAPAYALHLDNIRNAEDWFLAMRSYPNGIPRGARVRALEQAASLDTARTTSTQRRPFLNSDPSSWFPIGPTPVDGEAATNSVANDDSGRATAIAANPINPLEVWLGTATGGVWHTLNAQTTDPEWIPVTDLESVDGLTDANGGTIQAGAMAMSIGALVVDGCSATQGCARTWIGTGEDGIRRETYYGAGLFLETPQAQPQIKIAPNHTPRPQLPAGDPITQVADFSYGSVVAIAIPPHDPTTLNDTMYVAVSSGETAAGNEETKTAPAPSQGYGIYMSQHAATPGSFTKLPIPGIDRSLPTDVQFDPSDKSSGTVLVGVMARDPMDKMAARGILRGTQNGALWCSINDNSAANIPPCYQAPTNLPAGNSIISPPPPFGAQLPDEVLGEISLAFSPNLLGRVYALVGQCSSRVDGGCPFAAYRSDNDGQTWTSLPVGPPGAYQTYGRYTHVIVVPPNQQPNSEQILLGGTEIFVCNGVGAAGCSVLGDSASSTHADQHAIVFPDPKNPSVVYNGDDGGFFWSTNFNPSNPQPQQGQPYTANTFTAGNTTPTTIQVDGLAVVDQTLMAGLQDNGVAIFTGSRVWKSVYGFDGGQVVAFSNGSTPAQPVWMTTIQRGLPLMWQGTPTYSGANQLSTSAFTGPAGQEFVNEGPGAAQCAYFPPLAVNHKTGDLYIASVEVYKSSNGGQSWSPISPVLPLQQGSLIDDLNTDNVLTAMDVADDGTVYVGSYLGEVWEGNPAGTNWNKIAGPQTLGGSYGDLPNLPVSSIAIQPGDSSTAYVAYSGFLQNNTGNHVWGFVQNGLAHFSTSAGLVDTPADVIRFDSQGKLWLGTDVGIYGLQGSTWIRDETLPHVPVTAIASWPTTTPQGQRLYAGTHGRGVWILAQPNVTTLEGWSNNSIWDVPVYGSGFAGASDSCTIYLVQESGHVCAQGTVDVASSNYGPGLPIKTNTDGQLETGASGAPDCSGSAQPNYCWDHKPVAWACREGTCLGGVPIKNCNVTNGAVDQLSTVIVDCGSAGKGTATILNAPSLGNPPNPSQVSLQFDPPKTPPPNVPPPPPSWTFEAVVSIASPQAARLLCTAPVTVAQGASDEAIAIATAAALNASADCKNEGLVATARVAQSSQTEDEGNLPIGVSVSSQIQTGWQLFVTFRASPGASTGLCFIVDGMGDAVMHQSSIMQTVFSTALKGASGGAVRIVEQTNLGSCQQDVRTTPGMTATQVVGAIANAFGTIAPPGPAQCLSRANALDLQPSGSTLFSVIAQRMMICSFDSGVGMAITPDTVDVPNLPPDCSTVHVTPSQLWPPDHKMLPVTLSAAVDPDGDSVTMAVTQVRQDENPRGEVDAQLVNGQLFLRSERDGNGEGRVYHIDFTATDSQGGTCTGDATVCVPHDQGMADSCVDLGALYPSGVP